MTTSLKRKNLLPEGVNSFYYEQFLIVWKITFYHIKLPPLNVTIFSMYVHNLLNGCYASAFYLIIYLLNLHTLQQLHYKSHNIFLLSLICSNQSHLQQLALHMSCLCLLHYISQCMVDRQRDMSLNKKHQRFINAKQTFIFDIRFTVAFIPFTVYITTVKLS